MRGRLVEAGGRSGEALGAEFRQISVVGQGKVTARTKQPGLIYIYIDFDYRAPWGTEPLVVLLVYTWSLCTKVCNGQQEHGVLLP